MTRAEDAFEGECGSRNGRVVGEYGIETNGQRRLPLVVWGQS